MIPVSTLYDEYIDRLKLSEQKNLFKYIVPAPSRGIGTIKSFQNESNRNHSDFKREKFTWEVTECSRTKAQKLYNNVYNIYNNWNYIFWTWYGIGIYNNGQKLGPDIGSTRQPPG